MGPPFRQAQGPELVEGQISQIYADFLFLFGYTTEKKCKLVLGVHLAMLAWHDGHFEASFAYKFQICNFKSQIPRAWRSQGYF